jgi:hypothetical protein
MWRQWMTASPRLRGVAGVTNEIEVGRGRRARDGLNGMWLRSDLR